MDKVIEWLLSGDKCISFATQKYLLDSSEEELLQIQKSIENQGYAKVFLESRNSNGLWGKYYYQPKWTSTHYTLLDLKNMNINPENSICRDAVKRLIDDCMLENGGFNLAKSDLPNDNCIDGMILNYSSYFLEDDRLRKTVDMLISSQKEDGGFVQYTNDISDAHATICILEGLLEIRKKSNYRRNDIKQLELKAMNYLYDHHLFLDNKEAKKLHYPFRYYYSILRFLNYCADAHIAINSYIEEAINYLIEKQAKDGVWKLDGVYRGEVHCQLEDKKEDSRFVTVMSLKILKEYINQQE